MSLDYACHPNMAILAESPLLCSIKNLHVSLLLKETSVDAYVFYWEISYFLVFRENRTGLTRQLGWPSSDPLRKLYIAEAYKRDIRRESASLMQPNLYFYPHPSTPWSNVQRRRKRQNKIRFFFFLAWTQAMHSSHECGFFKLLILYPLPFPCSSLLVQSHC